MIELSVNIDHVATVRQARRGSDPDPLWAAVEAELGGADGITVHLREDRRHIQDRDVERLAETVRVKLNLEMAATREMIAIARRIRPHMVMLVPEGRREITTEGGLNVAGQRKPLREAVKKLNDAGLAVSAFIDPDARQVEAAAACGFAVCEVHTGPWAHAVEKGRRDLDSPPALRALKAVRETGAAILAAGMQFNAGHALNYNNVQPLAVLQGLSELHIGHAIVSRAVLAGMREAVREMKRLMREARGA